MGTEKTQQSEGAMGTEQRQPYVLYIDGDEEARASAVRFADEAGTGLSVDAVPDAKAARSILERETPDCLVTEYELTDTDGVAFCRRVREHGYDGPLVLYTAESPEAVARSAFSAGVDDFVTKRPDEDGHAFLFDKVWGAIEGEQVGTWTDDTHRPLETLVSLADETNDELWTAGSLDVLPPDPENVYDAVADVLESDSRFRTAVADTTGDGVSASRLWSLEAETGTVEHQRIELPALTDAARRLDIFHDVSDEQERQQRLTRFERLLDTASDGLYALDPNGHYTFVNESMAETLGYDREEMLGMHAANVLTEAEYERGQQQVTDIVSDTEQESGVLEMTVERADGSELPVAISFSPLYDGDNRYEGLVGVLRDISDRRERERRLRESERRYRTLAENIPHGCVGMYNEDMEYILVEGQLFDELSYDVEDFAGTALPEIHTDAFIEKFGAQYEAVFDGERSTFEFSHGGRYYRTNLVPIYDETGGIDAGLALSLDITEQREYERELERQNERLNDFASIVSHDLRNPLNVIEGRLALYREQGDETHLDSVEDGVETMKSLIDDLLELARSGQTLGETEPVDLERAATTCWDTVQTGEASLTIVGNPTIVADAGRFHQVFGNLFRNAIEHGSTDDRPHSDKGTDHSDTVVRLGLLEDRSGFFVEDNGPGIPEDRREDVLDYGVSGADDGTGIGLAIVREVADAHGWDVTVTESAEGGARFEFSDVTVPA
jgi:PAS domain S-box-containing protein